MRFNKDGSKHVHSKNIQDFPRRDLSPEGKAMYRFLDWASQRPAAGYYDLLPPSAKMAIDAVGRVETQLAVLNKESKK